MTRIDVPFDPSRKLNESTSGSSPGEGARSETQSGADSQRQSTVQVLLDTMPIGLLLIREGDCQHANPECCRILGTTADQAAGQGWLQTIHPDDRSRVEQSSAESRSGGATAPLAFEFRCVSKTDETSWVMCRSLNGELSHTFGTATVYVLTDITSIKTAELAWQGSERRFQSVVLALSEGVICIDSQGQILEVNDSCERILGWPREQLLSRRVNDPGWEARRTDGTPFPIEEFPANITLQTGQPQRDVIFGVRRSDGDWGWISVNTEGLFRPGEELPYAVVASVRDVTQSLQDAELQQSLLQLLERIARLEPLRDVLSELVNVMHRRVGLAGSILLFNRDEQCLETCVAPQLPAEFTRAVAKVAVGMNEGVCGTAAFLRQPVIVSDTLVHSTCESYRDVFARYGLRSCWSYPILSSTTQLLGTFAFYGLRPLAPTTQQLHLLETAAHLAGLALERSDIEHASRRQASHLLQAERLTGVGSYIWDSRRNCVRISEQLAAMCRLPGDQLELSAETAPQLIHPDDRLTFQTVWDRLLQHGGKAELEHRLLLADGTILHVDSHLEAIFDEQGHVIEIIGSVLNLTERVREEIHRRDLERQLFQTQKMESIGAMTQGIAHDFNNVLAAIEGSADLALLMESPRETRAQLEMIRSTVQHAAGFCQQLLMYAGISQPRIESIDVNQLIQSLKPLLLMSINNRATLNLELSLDAPQILADANQLQQVVLNLVINASEAFENLSRPAPGITIRTTLARVTDRDQHRAVLNPGNWQGSFLELSVSDNASGMPPGKETQLFEPFNSMKGTGRGLGLAIVQGVMRSHSGSILVDNQPGSGTSIRLLFPALPPKAASQSQPEGGAQGVSGKRILVVEDEELVRQIIVLTLKRAGMVLEEASDGRRALSRVSAASQPFDLILLDLSMPELDGAATLFELQSLAPGVPVVLMTGHSEEEARDMVGPLPLAGVLKKPFQMRELREFVTRLLSN